MGTDGRMSDNEGVETLPTEELEVIEQSRETEVHRTKKKKRCSECVFEMGSRVESGVDET